MSANDQSTAPALLFEKQDAVAVVTINDPPWNPMGLAFMDALENLVPQVAEDRSIRAVVLEGAGEEHFSVGMNLKELAGAARSQRDLEALLDQRLRVLSAIENMEKPWVAVLFGYCLGGGLELPLACHFRLAARDGAKIGLPELDIGTVPAWGGTARLTRCVGRMHALDMILRAKKISGPEAHRIGLVNEVWPNVELKARARELARQLADAPASSVAGVLRCVVGAGERSLQEALYEERRAVLRSSKSKDRIEGITAFLEKRKPRFNVE